MLHIYNSLTRRKEAFTPIEPGKIRLYACGVTVYDYFHIGNARMLVVFDTIVRYLRAAGYQVTYVRNITDVDDKIIQRAQSDGVDVGVITERFIQAMHEDTTRLGMLAPDVEPRATESIDDIITLIQTLLDKGLAYLADGDDALPWTRAGLRHRLGVAGPCGPHRRRVGRGNSLCQRLLCGVHRQRDRDERRADLRRRDGGRGRRAVARDANGAARA